MYAVFEGRKPDVWPVAAPYVMLSNADHWEELTGLPIWKYFEWHYSADMDYRRRMYKVMYDQQEFDIVQPEYMPSRNERENTEIIFRNGRAFVHNKRYDSSWPVPDNIHNSSSGGGENETRYIFNKSDARERLKTRKAEQLIESGCNDSIDELVKLYGDTRFIMSQGVVNTFFSNVYHVGMTNFYIMLHEEPELVAYISELVLEQNIEIIRAQAKSGVDAIFIDDATATSDMVSVQMYTKFSLPYLIPQVNEIKRLGKKAVLTYFGGINDRTDLIASTGADALMMECSMNWKTVSLL